MWLFNVSELHIWNNDRKSIPAYAIYSINCRCLRGEDRRRVREALVAVHLVNLRSYNVGYSLQVDFLQLQCIKATL